MNKRVSFKKTKNDLIEKLKQISNEKIKPIINDKVKPFIEEKIKTTYIGYSIRIAIFGILFILLFGISYLLVMKSITKTESISTTYQEMGTSDYKVMLKPNDFYESDYLPKGRIYVSSLIKSIDIDFNYRFVVDKLVDSNFNYSIVGKLSIASDSGAEYYSKEYTLLNNKVERSKNKSTYNLKQSVSIDYDYYNNIANKYKSTYGVDTTSNFIVYLKVGKNVKDINLNNSSQMSITIPLSQRSFNISSDEGINNTNTILTTPEAKLDKKFLIVIAVILFIAAVACLLKLLELVFKLFGKQSAYDKLLSKIFKEYDRFIVTTTTTPKFDDKNIIKIGTFEELLDARDTLKQPIMYYNISEHNKCYFYIKSVEDVYLTVIKAVDLESDKNEARKKNK